jgi:hypothetical protein
MNPEFNVQSLCIGHNRIVIGMRSGTILEMQISDDGTNLVSYNYDKKTKIRKWMKCIDNEVPISVAVDQISSKVYTITKAGLFTVWDLMTFDIVYQNDFHKVALNIISFKLIDRVLTVFENEVRVIEENIAERQQGKIDQGFDDLKQYLLKLDYISDAKLNSNE